MHKLSKFNTTMATMNKLKGIVRPGISIISAVLLLGLCWEFRPRLVDIVETTWLRSKSLYSLGNRCSRESPLFLGNIGIDIQLESFDPRIKPWFVMNSKSSKAIGYDHAELVSLQLLSSLAKENDFKNTFNEAASSGSFVEYEWKSDEDDASGISLSAPVLEYYRETKYEDRACMIENTKKDAVFSSSCDVRLLVREALLVTAMVLGLLVFLVLIVGYGICWTLLLKPLFVTGKLVIRTPSGHTITVDIDAGNIYRESESFDSTTTTFSDHSQEQQQQQQREEEEMADAQIIPNELVYAEPVLPNDLVQAEVLCIVDDD